MNEILMPVKESIVLIIIILVLALLPGCSAPGGPDRIVGTWEWSDGKGYVEQYTFGPDHSFRATALGSGFAGTWNVTSPGHYMVTYRDTNLTAGTGTFTETMIYDPETDEVYFPGHRRVLG